MNVATSAPSLHGRSREAQAVDDLLARVVERGGVLVVRGEAGIGKSALLAEARTCAERRGMRILTAAGVQSEAHLPFAGLHHLLRPALSELDRLPPPQRAAVEAAFGAVEGVAPDIFLIALAALDLIADMATNAPLVLVVDDAHWLDAPTCEVLAFVARRVELEPVVLLFAVRDGFGSRFDEMGLPELQLGGLDEEATGALLDAHAPTLAAGMRRRVLDDAAGNPLALIELPRALPADGAEGSPLPEPLPLTARLERAFASRLSEFPPETRALLLAAALDTGRDLQEIAAAASVLVGRDVTGAAAAPAVTARLVDIGTDGLEFHHPLVRSAIYQAAGVQERRRAHAALAEVFGAQPDRRAWHRAAACAGPDEGAAGELEAAAERAQRRGGVDVAIAALERAARLTDDPSRKGERLLRAAALAFELGRQEVLLRLVREAEALELDTPARARLTLIREMAGGRVAMVVGARVESLLETATSASDAGDPELALSLLWAAASRCYWTDHGRETRMAVVGAAERMSELSRDPRLVAILAFAAPIERGRLVIEYLSDVVTADDAVRDGAVARSLGAAAHAVGAFELSAQIFAAGISNLRAQGRLALLARALVLQSRSDIHLGRLREAEAVADEGGRLAAETGEPLFAAGGRAGLAIIAAMRGEADAALRLASEAERPSLPLGGSAVLAAVQLTRGLVALGAGRHLDAYEELARMFDPGDPSFHVMESAWAIGDLAEAAVHSLQTERARAVLAGIERLASETPSSRVHVALGYARPLLADDDEAEAHYHESLSADLSLWPFDRARLLLAYGAWLRRHRRVAESRAPLRASLATFDALGASPWAERARQELRASGETSRRRTHEARDHLTPQELQIAQMAAEGLTNREIGQRLYLSHRTVGSHLYRLFPKLGITSRNQLRAVLTPE